MTLLWATLWEGVVRVDNPPILLFAFLIGVVMAVIDLRLWPSHDRPARIAVRTFAFMAILQTLQGIVTAFQMNDPLASLSSIAWTIRFLVACAGLGITLYVATYPLPRRFRRPAVPHAHDMPPAILPSHSEHG